MTDEGSIFGLSPKRKVSPKKNGKTADASEPQTEEAPKAEETKQAKKPAPKKTPSKRKPRAKAKTKEQQLEKNDAPSTEDDKPAGKDASKKDDAPKKAPAKKTAAKKKAPARKPRKQPSAPKAEADAPAEPKEQQPVQDKEAQPAKPAQTRAKASRPAVEQVPQAPEEPREEGSATEQFASARPDEVVEPEDALPQMKLEDLPERLQEACRNAGWDKLMPVQSMAVPYLLAGRDLMIQSRTGSGKTGSFTLPVIDKINPEKAKCQALVLVPTRELAQQVAREAETLAGQDDIRVAAVYGGTGYGQQLDALNAGAHIVVGTPGRVLDHLLRRSLDLSDLECLIFDEADRMLSIGFYPDMKAVQRYLPAKKVNMFMTSATYPPHVMRLAKEFMDKPSILSLSHKMVHIAETPHIYYECKPMEKDRALTRIIEMENPASAFVFCNTKSNVHYITAVLQRFGYDADELSGDLSQNKREAVLTRIRKGELRFLVTTDVAARGIDIPDLSHVFMYEPPEDHEVYIHRAGRTGRAGASGEVISLVDVMEKLALERIAKTYKITLEKHELPSEEDVQSIIAERMTALLEAKLRKLDNVERERLNRSKELVEQLNKDEEGRALIAMLLDELYQQTISKAPPKPPSDEEGDKNDTKRKRRRRKRPPRNKKPADNAQKQQQSEGKATQDSGGNKPKANPNRRRRPRRRRKKPSGNSEPNGNKAE